MGLPPPAILAIYHLFIPAVETHRNKLPTPEAPNIRPYAAQETSEQSINEHCTHTCTFLTLMLASGVAGNSIDEAAINAPTKNATVVKKPKRFCIRTRVECIVAGLSCVNRARLVIVGRDGFVGAVHGL